MNNQKRFTKIREKIYNTVYKFPTKYKEGFVKSEIETVLKEFPSVNMEKFDNALMGITCQMKEGELVIYHCDIEHALRAGIENRELYGYEFD